jgi:Uncharacterized protein conserved in bacteria
MMFFAGAVSAQNSINGVIFNENRRPVADIEVELLDEYERLLRYVKTNSSGLYAFVGLRAGVYYINVRVGRTNFKPAKERIQLGEANRTSRTTGAISGGEAAQVNITLQTDRRGELNAPLYNEVVFAQNVPAEAEKLYEEAIKLFEKNKPEEGASALEAALKIYPKYFLALDRLGNEYLMRGKYAEAEPLFEKAFAVNPKSFSSSYGLGAAQYQLKKTDQALKSLEAAVVLNPASINCFYLIGRIHRELKNYDAAETNLKKAESLSKEKLPDIHWELALLYYHNLNRPSDAADQLELYLKANPKNPNKAQIEKLIKQIREKSK